MDLSVRSDLAIVRPSATATAPPAEAETRPSAIVGIAAPGLQVAALVEPGKVQNGRRHMPSEEQDAVAPLLSAAPLPDGLANRYRYKIAHAPDLDRPLLQIVDEKTDQIVVSLPPEQLARMLEDAKALAEDRFKGPHLRHLDTTV